MQSRLCARPTNTRINFLTLTSTFDLSHLSSLLNLLLSHTQLSTRRIERYMPRIHLQRPT
jgi:hypothetical protein